MSNELKQMSSICYQLISGSICPVLHLRSFHPVQSEASIPMSDFQLTNGANIPTIDDDNEFGREIEMITMNLTKDSL